MTDSEWIANIHNVSNAEIFEQLENCGCDGYYRDIWNACIEELQRRVNNPSGDLISRDALKEKLKERYYNGGLDIVTAIELIDNAPPVPERQQGEWIYGEDDCGQDGWICSKCNFFVPWYYAYYENDIDFIREYKACPHCLAEMVTYTGKDRDTKGGAE